MRIKSGHTRQARKVLENRYGNLIAYRGNARVYDFGTDYQSAREWVGFGVFCSPTSKTEWLAPAIDGSHTRAEADAPKATREEIDAVRAGAPNKFYFNI